MSSIAAILKHYGASKVPEGRGWRKMRCPFHDDTHASAGVNHEAESFNCFTCDIAGNFFVIIMKIERVEFSEAKSRAEEIVGTSLEALPTKHSFGRKLSQQQGTISGRRKETSTGSSSISSRRSRNV